jgi:hypothetical protein
MPRPHDDYAPTPAELRDADIREARDNLAEANATLAKAEQALRAAKEALESFEPDDDEAHERYDAMLNDCYSFAKVGGPFEHMQPSEVLKECDPTAYRCGFNDWLDGEDKSTFDGYSDLEEAVELAESERDDAENARDDAEAALEALTGDDGDVGPLPRGNPYDGRP